MPASCSRAARPRCLPATTTSCRPTSMCTRQSAWSTTHCSAGCAKAYRRPSAVVGSAAEELMVCRLFCGGRWIRTSSTRARCIWLSRLPALDWSARPFCRPILSGTRPKATRSAIVVPPAADPTQATGSVKRRDNQMHRARVLEVRIHLPPAKSLLRNSVPFARVAAICLNVRR